jgi:outer membrane protein OmpA-like peptidoglycan-associated protein
MRPTSIFLAILFATMPAWSQQPSERSGGYFHIVFSNYQAAFTGLPGVPSCCPIYDDGGGIGFATGLLYEHPFAKQLMYQLRLGVANLGGSFEADEHTTVSVDGFATPGLIRHTIDTRLWAIEFSPLLVYKPYPKFSFLLGGIGGYLFAKRFSQKEALVEPDIGAFENGLRERNAIEGDIPRVNALQFSLAAGARYDFPFDQRKRWWGALELFYTAGLTSVAEDINWHINTVRIGVALMYAGSTESNPEIGAAYVPPGSLRRRDGTEDRQPPPASGASDQTEAGQTTETSQYTVRDESVIADHLRPLLNFVFFDHNSAAIDKRYTALTPDDMKEFSVNRLHRSGTMAIYYQLLNIVGKRLTDYPHATITLVGCNSNTAEERENISLSRRRALEVRQYLASVWRIDAARMSIEARNLPERASYATDSDGIVENRRVEIHSNEWNILAPVETEEVVRLYEPDSLRCALPEAGSEAKRWTLSARDGDEVVYRARGSGNPPQRIVIPAKELATASPGSSRTLRLSLAVVAPSGDTRTFDAGSVAVSSVASKEGQYETRSGRKIQRFNLILFDFDSPALNAYHNRVIDIIKSRMLTPSAIRVTGYTDRMGEADYNLRLSAGRARSTSDALGTSGIQHNGMGETRTFDNDLPEGRCYNRTVEIEVVAGDK